ncbi:LamG-like jellyroll fold domain-containing protein [Zobellia galactanivorans]|uniref:LamG-like jellyroll fold domain-containing protein n=1 Tax=Zobellia galactanivorans (strain DSM 12802 / CCUG 47099 / CIP 106680 / NCIMB 13871 / Dsij) TaxID=63186 RepID=UPI001C065E3D|nr:LamG-like jellyroll fold domain-containing protein [Zobellia galactanivorans]MBU3024458.1 LamG domain-containing protein [Zobellia galactanivorans]
MKNIKNLVSCLMVATLFYSCDQGIDALTEVDPGADASAPTITITSPAEGAAVKVNEELATITVRFQAEDDIELGSVEVLLDGTRIGNYNTFKDYRKLIVDDLVYDQLEDGAHQLTVIAKDLDGKSTSEVINFTKEPAYISKYPGEILYMPFDGGYVDLLSFEEAEQVGSPAISEESLAGSGAYAGAEGAYLTLDPERFKNTELSAIFWVKLNAMPDRAGILAMSPPLDDAGGNVLTSGFRFFRENANGQQRYKLNVGEGDKNTWFDGGEAAEVDPASEEWVNLAFTISGSEAVVYIDGQIVSQGPLGGIDWNDVNVLSIMSGEPNFSGWNHKSDLSLMDELRIFDRAITQDEIKQIIQDDSGIVVSDYPPNFPGEMFYMPFDGTYKNLFTDIAADLVGTPSFSEDDVVAGDASYMGATDSYLTVPSNGLTPDAFSATLWYKVDASSGNGGILVMSPEDTEKEGFPEVQNLRTSGFRFFREGDATRQVFKLNVGTGESDVWLDGADAAAIDPTTAGWVHLAFSISESDAVLYINGEIVAQNSVDGGIDWSGCDILSIGSGAPRFTEWGHLSNESLIDELRFFDKALTQEEIQGIMNHNL